MNIETSKALNKAIPVWVETYLAYAQTYADPSAENIGVAGMLTEGLVDLTPQELKEMVVASMFGATHMVKQLVTDILEDLQDRKEISLTEEEKEIVTKKAVVDVAEDLRKTLFGPSPGM